MPNTNPNDPNDMTQPQTPVPGTQAGQPALADATQPHRPVYRAQPGYPYGPQVMQAPAQANNPQTPLPQVPQGYAYGSPYTTQPGYPQPGYYQPGYTQSGVLPAVVSQPNAAPANPPRRPVRSGGRTIAIAALTCLLAVVFGVGLFSGWTYARSSAGTNSTVTSSASTSTTTSTALDTQAVREEAIAKVTPAVVEVIGAVSQGTALGSGIIVDKNGDIITNNHVVDGASSLQIQLSNGHVVPAQLVGTDVSNDLAVLRIQPYSGMVVASLGDSSKLTIGQEVLAIGNPLGYSGTATSGVVSALNRSAQESRTVNLTGLIQISTPINPGLRFQP